ncbi:NAD(P)H-binding protein [Maritimibacter sp. DP07]|uniref:NAD(P)H-binding protein n=1 Tax=Maritimibacter harenae TaxID=2606218 RepID=A0A845M6C4_9RHOB|nr:NAD(P)H-binding protein [Maritimibacter harenae]MZR11944.1 NAD(P)H-binding protein [Maritimibacter harenae]
MKRICIIGISGKLGQYMTEHALKMGYEVQGVCRPESVGKLARFEGRIKIFPGRTNDREVIRKAVEGCDGVLTVLVPWGVDDYASGTAKAVLAFADPGARLVFSCGWHITMDGRDHYGFRMKAALAIAKLARFTRLLDVDDQYRATDAIFASNRLWTVVRGSDLEEGESQGLPIWAEHVQDPRLASNLTRRTDFALFMVRALTDDSLVHKAPAIVSRVSASATAHAA